MLKSQGLRNLSWLWISVVIIALDQWTKLLAVDHLQLYRPHEVFPFINMTLAYNTGAAFSMLSEAGGWQIWFLGGLAAMVSGGLLLWLYRLPRNARLHQVSLTLILGGALGNLIDRIRLGHVVDFIDVYVKTWHWPAFNVADSAICVGAVLLVLTLFCYSEAGSK